MFRNTYNSQYSNNYNNNYNSIYNNNNYSNYNNTFSFNNTNNNINIKYANNNYNSYSINNNNNNNNYNNNYNYNLYNPHSTNNNIQSTPNFIHSLTTTKNPQTFINTSNLIMTPKPKIKLNTPSITPSNFTSNTYIFKTSKNPYIIPQYRRMELMQRRLRELEEDNINNNIKLKNLIENDYLSRINYPKYTIIQNTPMSNRYEIINKILEKKFGKNFVHSNNFPIGIYKNDDEVNELVKINTENYIRKLDEKKAEQIENNKEEINNLLKSNENKNKLLLDIQKENFNLRNGIQDIKNKMNKMNNDIQNNYNEILNSQKLTIENLRNIIEQGGSEKLKASMQNILNKNENNIFNTDQNKNKINNSNIKSENEGMNENWINNILPEIIQKKIDENLEEKNINKLLKRHKNSIHDLSINSSKKSSKKISKNSNNIINKSENKSENSSHFFKKLKNNIDKENSEFNSSEYENLDKTPSYVIKYKKKKNKDEINHSNKILTLNDHYLEIAKEKMEEKKRKLKEKLKEKKLIDEYNNGNKKKKNKKKKYK